MKINDVVNESISEPETPQEFWSAALSVCVTGSTANITTREREELRNRNYPEIERWALTQGPVYVRNYAVAIFPRVRWIEAEPILRTVPLYYYQYIDRLRLTTPINDSMRKFYRNYNKSMGFDVDD